MNVFTLGARVLLAISLFFVVAGCGGGSKDPVAPQSPTLYRVLLFDHIYGGKAVNEIVVQKGVPAEDRQFMLRLECTNLDGRWVPVTEELPFTITVMGAPSGTWLPDIGLSGGQFRLKAGEFLLEFQPPLDGHLGTATLEVHVPDVGASTTFTVTIVAGAVIPPPTQTCRDIHPTREAIDGYWWDCVDGVWQNTGEPADQPPPPPTGELHAHGAFGELHSGDILHITKGEGKIFQLFVGDVSINPQEVTFFTTSTLPQWVWMPDASEISTVYPIGNPVYIPVGEYDFSLWYGDKKLKLHLIVDPNRNLPRWVQNYLGIPDKW